MDWEYGHESKECACKFCGEESDAEFCSRECIKGYKSDN